MDLNNDGIVKKILIDRLYMYFEHKVKRNASGVLDKFYTNSKNVYWQFKICNKFIQSTVGRAKFLIDRMKSLPDKIALKESTFFE